LPGERGEKKKLGGSNVCLTFTDKTAEHGLIGKIGISVWNTGKGNAPHAFRPIEVNGKSRRVVVKGEKGTNTAWAKEPHTSNKVFSSIEIPGEKKSSGEKKGWGDARR